MLSESLHTKHNKQLKHVQNYSLNHVTIMQTTNPDAHAISVHAHEKQTWALSPLSGLASYYLRFIPNFANEDGPLHMLTRAMFHFCTQNLVRRVIGSSSHHPRCLISQSHLCCKWMRHPIAYNACHNLSMHEYWYEITHPTVTLWTLKVTTRTASLSWQ